MLVAATVVSVAAAGCSRPTGREVGHDSAPRQRGEIIDASSFAVECERREILRQLLDGIVRGEDIALIENLLPGVDFRESQATFFSGNLLLSRWEFAPQAVPASDSISVTLEFIPADDFIAKRIERRTYEVTGQRGAWVVDRSIADQLPP